MRRAGDRGLGAADAPVARRGAGARTRRHRRVSGGAGGRARDRQPLDEPCRVLILSSKSPLAVIHYPDSKKVGSCRRPAATSTCSPRNPSSTTGRANDERNLLGDEWEGGRDRPGWQWRYADVGTPKIGASLYELAPGQATFPYHWHQLEEEWLIVLAGEPTLRSPTASSGSRPGCGRLPGRPRGRASPSQRHRGARAALMLSSRSPGGEICFYPDSGKIGLFGPELRKMVAAEPDLDYFHNEE